jgi:signal transduction histidine kinase
VALIDRERITQVLVNLLTNAFRHTRDGQVRVSVTTADRFAEVAVADTGSGIDPHLLEQLGQRPVQGRHDGVRSSRDAGLGVGLMISTHIIAAHGGRLWLESKVGGGTTARFTVPLA